MHSPGEQLLLLLPLCGSLGLFPNKDASWSPLKGTPDPTSFTTFLIYCFVCVCVHILRVCTDTGVGRRSHLQ